MKISQIILKDFRVYQGTNKISFDHASENNINIITGKNGYGKTTFLTSLIWAFYGRLMGQVEDKYRLDIKAMGGYECFLESLVNRNTLSDFNNNKINKSVCSVEITLTDIMLPSIPCNNVTIKRSYDFKNKSESLSILIDGQENELTKDVGYEVFINDFILPREIAKFFFFDAEKIVALAEAKSKEELRNLSRAYSEVLGIKKYEDLKKNLEALLAKLKRNGVSEFNKIKLQELEKKKLELLKLIESNESKCVEIDRELSAKRKVNDELQEKLIREGNVITLDELQAFREEKEELQKQSSVIKRELNKLMDFAPFIIAGKKLVALREQLLAEKEQVDYVVAKSAIKNEIETFSRNVLKQIEKKKLFENDRIVLEGILQDTLKETYSKTTTNKQTPILLGFDNEQYLNFEAVYSNIQTSYITSLNNLVQEEKSNRVLLSTVSKKIKQAEARDDNTVVKKYAAEKEIIVSKIEGLLKDKEEEFQNMGALKMQLKNIQKENTEYLKNYTLQAVDKKKYKVTTELLEKINHLIGKIKVEKKYALQKSLYLGLMKLMHKDNFIKNVNIVIDNDIMDIQLVDQSNRVIPKDSLSKGEQQLYATALLKALVEESGIEFPVFIDSPLQKFDKQHSENIITEFYPTISNQVVLLPLLEKELTKHEFKLLEPNLNKTFLIDNKGNNSFIRECDLKTVFKEAKEHVYTN